MVKELKRVANLLPPDQVISENSSRETLPKTISKNPLTLTLRQA